MDVIFSPSYFPNPYDFFCGIQKVKCRTCNPKVENSSLRSGRNCRWGGVNVQRFLHPQHHNLGVLEQGTKPPTAPRAPQHKWLPTAPDVCSQCVCVFTAVCVHFVLVKCRAQIRSMGNQFRVCHVTFTVTVTFTFTGLIESTYLGLRNHFYVAYLTARFAAVSKRNVHWVVLKHGFNT